MNIDNNGAAESCENENMDEVAGCEPQQESDKEIQEKENIVKEAKENKVNNDFDDENKCLKKELAALSDKYLRLMAEYDNFRKRSLKEKDAIYPEATAFVATAFLEVADNFERAVAAQCTDPEYKKGTELTYKSLENALSKLNIEQFGEVGDIFEPQLHNAVVHTEDENQDSCVIVRFFKKVIA
jgi:molecular chaperone GrpE